VTFATFEINTRSFRPIVDFISGVKPSVEFPHNLKYYDVAIPLNCKRFALRNTKFKKNKIMLGDDHKELSQSKGRGFAQCGQGGGVLQMRRISPFVANVTSYLLTFTRNYKICTLSISLFNAFKLLFKCF